MNKHRLPTLGTVSLIKVADWSLRTQLLCIYGMLLLIFAVASGGLISKAITRTNDQQLDRLGESLSKHIAIIAVPMLVADDRLSLSALLNQMVQNPYILAAAIISVDYQPIAKAENRNSHSNLVGNDQHTVYSAPIHYQDVTAGYVQLTLNQAALADSPKQAVRTIIVVSLLLLLLGLGVCYGYGGYLSRRLARIEQQLHALLFKQSNISDHANLINRLATVVERELTNTVQDNRQSHTAHTNKRRCTVADDTVAVLGVRLSNLKKLRQLLTPETLMASLRWQLAIITQAAQHYGGVSHYTLEGNGYIQFARRTRDHFASDALWCGLLVHHLFHKIAPQQVINLPCGLGLYFGQAPLAWSDTQHPVLADDNAVHQALLLASLPTKSNGLCVLRSHLDWLAAEQRDVVLSAHGEETVLVTDCTDNAIIAQQAETLVKALSEQTV